MSGPGRDKRDRDDEDDGYPPLSPRRVLVTMHYPLDMHCVAMLMKAVADAYPSAVVGEDGTIWDRREDSA
jgi:hypothetical protein